MSGITDGPWAVSKRASRRVTTTHGIVICNAVLRNTGGAKNGIKNGAKEVLEAEANARLIAAAPELLEALKMFREFGCPVCSGDCGGANPPVVTCPMQIASAAIAKATGQ